MSWLSNVGIFLHHYISNDMKKDGKNISELQDHVALTLLMNRDFNTFRDYLMQFPLDYTVEPVRFCRYELHTIVSYVSQSFDIEYTFAMPSMPIVNDSILSPSYFLDEVEETSLEFNARIIGLPSKIDIFEPHNPSWPANRWQFSVKAASIFKDLIPYVSLSTSPVSMLDPLLGVSYAYWLFYVVEAHNMDLSTMKVSLDRVFKRSAEILVQIDQLAKKMWSHEGTLPSHIIVLKHYVCLIYLTIAKISMRCRLIDCRSRAAACVLHSERNSSSKPSLDPFSDNPMENSDTIVDDNSLKWLRIVNAIRSDKLETYCVDDGYQWFDSYEILTFLLEFALNPYPSLCVESTCQGASLSFLNLSDTRSNDFSLHSVAVKVLMQMGIDAIDEIISMNYFIFIGKMCASQRASFIARDIIPQILFPSAQTISKQTCFKSNCRSSCSSWWLTNRKVGSVSSIIEKFYSCKQSETNFDSLSNYRSFTLDSSVSTSLISLSSEYLALSPALSSNNSLDNWSFSHPSFAPISLLGKLPIIPSVSPPSSRVFSSSAQASCPCEILNVATVLDTIPRYNRQGSVGETNPCCLFEFALELAKKSAQIDVETMLSAIWTVVLMKLFWRYDIPGFLICLADLDSTGKAALQHLPPQLGNFLTRRICQVKIILGRSILFQYRQHVASASASNFCPGQIVYINIGETRISAVYISFDNSTKPIYLSVLNGIDCWSILGRDLSVLASWKPIQVDNHHLQPGSSLQSNIFLRIIIHNFRQKNYSVSDLIHDIRKRENLVVDEIH